MLTVTLKCNRQCSHVIVNYCPKTPTLWQKISITASPHLPHCTYQVNIFCLIVCCIVVPSSSACNVCSTTCPYGYDMDPVGCPICSPCFDPCSVLLHSLRLLGIRSSDIVEREKTNNVVNSVCVAHN